MAFTPTYQDYLALSNYGDAPLKPEDWARLDPETQFNMIGGGLILRPNDSRYNDFKPQVGGADGRNVWVTPNDVSQLHGGLVNPSAQYRGQGIFAHSEDNQSPSQQAFGHQQGAGMAAVLPLLFLGAGALAGGLGGATGAGLEGAAGLGEGAAGAGADISPGLLSNFATPEVGALNMGGLDSAMSGLGYEGWGAAAGAAGGGSSGMGEGMLDPETMGGRGGMGVAQNGIGPGSFGDRVMGAFNNPSSLLSGNGLLSGMGNMGLSDYIRLAGLAQSASGLFSGGGRSGGNGGGGGNNGGGKGGNGQGLNVTRGEYTPNPITAAQIQNFRYAQPRGR